MNSNPLIVTAETFPHGVRCSRCHEPIPLGAEYETELDDKTISEIASPLGIDAMLADGEEIIPIADIICGGCAHVR